MEQALVEELKAIFYSVEEEVVKKISQPTIEFKPKDANKTEMASVSKCPFSGKTSTSEGG